MKKIALTLSLFTILSIFSFVSAQEETLPSAGITPDSPFYFLDTTFEDIITLFTFGDEAKINRYLDRANERIAEIQAMAESDNPDALQNATDRYERLLERVSSRAQRAVKKASIEERIASMTGNQQLVLERVLQNAPEAAREGLENAIERSGTNHKQHLEDLLELDGEKAGAVAAGILKNRLRKLKEIAEDQGIPVEELEEYLGVHDEYDAFIERLKKDDDRFKSGLLDKLGDVYGSVYDLQEFTREDLPEDFQSEIRERGRSFLQRSNEDLRDLSERELERASKIYEKHLIGISNQLENRPEFDGTRRKILSDIEEFDVIGRDISDRAQLNDGHELKERVLQRIEGATQQRLDTLNRVLENVDEDTHDTIQRVIESGEINRDILIDRLRRLETHD